MEDLLYVVAETVLLEAGFVKDITYSKNPEENAFTMETDDGRKFEVSIRQVWLFHKRKWN